MSVRMLTVVSMAQPDECDHQKIPVEVATGRRLDLEQEDLGHPDDPGLWDRLHGSCRVGVLVCADCAETSPKRYLYLQEWRGIRRVCVYPLDQVIAAGLSESAEHRALKDKVCELAERQGLVADQEESGAGRKRRTDVVVRGGVAPVGWEVQLSPINAPLLRKRIKIAAGDGLVPSWLTMRGTGGFKDLIDRAPACTSKALASLEIATANDIRVFQGVKNLRIVDCTFQRTQGWHRGLACTGKHALPAGLSEDRHPSLAQMITMSATGDVVAIEWPRKLSLGYNRPWLWVSRAHARQFYEVERPSLERAGMATEPTLYPAAVPAQAGWHVAPTDWGAGYRSHEDPADDLPAAMGGLAAILGNQCPRCGWTRNRHRWHCPTGLSDVAEPQFPVWP